MRQAARKGKAEVALRRVLEDRGLRAEIMLRELGGEMSASVILSGEPADLDEPGLEAALKEASGIGRVVIIRTAHGAGAPPKSAQPNGPPPSGGHADPLRLGSRPKEQNGPKRPEGVGAVIAVASGKGGVGKSTVAANLALDLAARGLQVGLLDLDIHGPSLPVLFPHEGKLKAEGGRIVPAEHAGLKLVSIGYMVDERQAVAWRGPMVMNAARQLIEDTNWGTLDVLVVDTPPGTGDAHLSMIQRLKLDGAVLVATPSPLATADVRRGAALFRKVGTPVLGIVLNMTGGPMGDDLEPSLLEELGLDVLQRLPLAAEWAQLPSGGSDAPRLGEVVHAILKASAMTGRDSGEGRA